MTAIRITGGACGAGAGDYEDGVFTMPDGTTRGVETLSALDGPEAIDPPSHWSGDLVRGLQGAMASAEKLPRPLSVAASALGFGLGAFEAKPPVATLRAAFTDGSDAVIEVEADLAALIARDRTVIGAALARQVQPAPARTVFASDADRVKTPLLETPLSETPMLETAMFEYEKRNGRLRRVARKEPAGG
ncbi:hypothetical protein [uncultured Methylobacterium sp.]|uniref:hypothetical protein n=1 Tax=uncultured Methylobacterium sp. TaxID=157278 RepID=UPI0035CBFE7A